MQNLSRNQLLALIAVLICVALVSAGSLLKSFSGSSGTAVTIHDAFSHAPAAPIPVQPSDRTPPPLSQLSPKIGETPGQNAGAPVQPGTESAAATADVLVHVVGAVKRPGVYHLRPGSRWDDAVKAAGGSKPDADPDAVNLAARVEDGTRIVIPTKAQAAAAPPEAFVQAPVAAAPPVARTAPHPRAAGRHASHSNKLTDPSQGQIDLNRATADQLMRVPGIGPSMASKILQFRQESHGFKTVEDLMQVSGIGDKKFEKMRPFVTVR